MANQIGNSSEEETGSMAFSPEGVIMLTLAGILDLFDLLVGSFWIVDLIAIFLIGSWLFFRSGTLKLSKKAFTRLRKLRFFSILVEFIPIIGVLPCWTLLVYFELKHS